MNANTAPALVAYTRTAVVFHWLVAVAIIASLIMGWQMVEMRISPDRLKLYNWHKWLGMTILALSAARLLWRLTHPAPPLPAMPTWQQRVSSATHALFYVLFFAVPIMGWIYSSATGFPVVYLGLIQLPDLIEADRELAETLKPIHKYLAYTLAALVVLHVAAAFKHQFIDRDGLLARMRWRRPQTGLS